MKLKHPEYRFKRMIPWFKGFIGEVNPKDDDISY
jgi:hypothetical protein